MSPVFGEGTADVLAARGVGRVEEWGGEALPPLLGLPSIKHQRLFIGLCRYGITSFGTSLSPREREYAPYQTERGNWSKCGNI